jgi:hypothetical protein
VTKGAGYGKPLGRVVEVLNGLSAICSEFMRYKEI